MLTLAQCEKAVTNAELIGCGLRGFQLPQELSTTEPVLTLPSKERSPANLESLPTAISRFVFNSLRVKTALKRRRFRNPYEYLQNRAFVLLRGEWFGPSFVTIMPTGVCVCSF
jgi:hypothetical protein